MTLNLSVRGVSKRFGGVQALADVSVDISAGQIHAVLGENGAGKSTLIKALAGVHRPDEGSIIVEGTEVAFARPADALETGIAVVPQERTLVPSMSVAENILLGKRPTRRGMVDFAAMEDQASEWLGRLELDLEPRRQADTLRVAEAQLVEIARALAAEAQLLILDEPTASLGDAEVERLFAALRGLRDDGTAIVFVSHKLDQVLDLCDVATILRDGQVVATGLDVASLSRDDIIEYMVGRTVSFDPIREHDQTSFADIALELDHVSTEAGHHDICLRLHRGEVLGVYGLVGAGRSELATAVIGETAITAGRVLVAGTPVTIDSVRDAVQNHRIAYLSEDRKSTGLVLSHSIFANAALGVRDRLSRWWGWLAPSAEASSVAPVLEGLSTRYASGTDAVASLSGGNQQKVSLAKWLATTPEILIVDEPTVGIDVATKDQIHRLLRRLANEKIAVLVISSELPELVRVCDQIIVMHDFTIRGVLGNSGDYENVSKRAMRLIHTSTEREPADEQ